MPQISDFDRLANFDHYLRRAIFFGEQHEVSCIGLNCATWRAIHVVGREFPNVTYESVLLARKVFETTVDMNAVAAHYRALSVRCGPHDTTEQEHLQRR